MSIDLSDLDLEELTDLRSLTSNGYQYPDPTEGPPPRNPRRGITKQFCDAMNDYLEDHTQAETAEHFGIPVRTVRRHDQSSTNCECSHEQAVVDERQCAVARERALDGQTIQEVADWLGCDRSTAMFHLRGECACEHTVPVLDR